MKKIFKLFTLIAVVGLVSCTSSEEATSEQTDSEFAKSDQSTVKDEMSDNNVVQVAVNSPDHSTLVTAVKAAGLVDVLSNVGPFTVFAPTNAAFDALPEGVVDDLLKPENKSKLSDILEYHVYVGVIRENLMQDGMTLNQVNSKNVTITKDGDKLTVNGANILGAVEASNGIVYVIDKVLLPN